MEIKLETLKLKQNGGRYCNYCKILCGYVFSNICAVSPAEIWLLKYFSQQHRIESTIMPDYRFVMWHMWLKNGQKETVCERK